ncbi:SGNH/GDSL hydrolase family protein [Chitinophaga sp. XS-30]|uniref:SGNH/GDSL hydrolase family protein n=1 Tax=Chitinophaga sp. XS-30 TaxID=2604421 RepID=UPI00143D1978|nr:SGNH/GDSL hydrolase family protein [Chitinophaga sp. XS-30]
MNRQQLKSATQRRPDKGYAAGFLKRTCLSLLPALLCMHAAHAQTAEELIAASQAGASPLYFDVHTANVPLVTTGSFRDERECNVRKGLPNFFHKALNGKTVTAGFIGGSITQGSACYRPQTAKYLQSMFPGVTLKALNAGVSGTGTDLGACRLHDQLLQYHPDLIFVEFAVNGAYAPGMEGIIRQIRQFDPEIDICLIYTISNGQTKIYAEGDVPENIAGLEKVAAHYGIPSIHLGMEAAMLEKSGELHWKHNGDVPGKIIFSRDGIHPLPAGGNLYAAAIARGMQQMKKLNTPLRHAIPAPLFPDNWEDAGMYAPLELAQFSEGWQKTATRQQFAAWFPYIMEASAPGASFTFRFNGTAFGLFTIGGPEAGQLGITVDGKPLPLSTRPLPGTRIFRPGEQPWLNLFNSYCNNRYRGQHDLVALPPGDHTVTIQLSTEKADKVKILGAQRQEDILQHPEKYDRTVIYLGKILLRGRRI